MAPIFFSTDLICKSRSSRPFPLHSDWPFGLVCKFEVYRSSVGFGLLFSSSKLLIRFNSWHLSSLAVDAAWGVGWAESEALRAGVRIDQTLRSLPLPDPAFGASLISKSIATTGGPVRIRCFLSIGRLLWQRWHQKVGPKRPFRRSFAFFFWTVVWVLLALSSRVYKSLYLEAEVEVQLKPVRPNGTAAELLVA